MTGTAGWMRVFVCHMFIDILKSDWLKRQGPTAVVGIVALLIVTLMSLRCQQHTERLGEQHTQQITAIVLRVNSSMSRDELHRTLREIRRGER